MISCSPGSENSLSNNFFLSNGEHVLIDAIQHQMSQSLFSTKGPPILK